MKKKKRGLRQIDQQRKKNALCKYCKSDRVAFIGRGPGQNIPIFECLSCKMRWTNGKDGAPYMRFAIDQSNRLALERKW